MIQVFVIDGIKKISFDVASELSFKKGGVISVKDGNLTSWREPPIVG